MTPLDLGCGNFFWFIMGICLTEAPIERTSVVYCEYCSAPDSARPLNNIPSVQDASGQSVLFSTLSWASVHNDSIQIGGHAKHSYHLHPPDKVPEVTSGLHLPFPFLRLLIIYELGFIGKPFGESQDILRQRAFPFALTELGGNVALFRHNSTPVARINLH